MLMLFEQRCCPLGGYVRCILGCKSVKSGQKHMASWYFWPNFTIIQSHSYYNQIDENFYFKADFREVSRDGRGYFWLQLYGLGFHLLGVRMYPRYLKFHTSTVDELVQTVIASGKEKSFISFRLILVQIFAAAIDLTSVSVSHNCSYQQKGQHHPLIKSSW